MEKFGQAEYAYDILRQITEKLLAENILTQEQQKNWMSRIKTTAIVSSAQLGRRKFSDFGDSNFGEIVVLL